MFGEITPMRTAVRRHGRVLSWQSRTALVAVAMVGLVALGSAVTRGGDQPPAARGGAPPAPLDWSSAVTPDPPRTSAASPQPEPSATTPAQRKTPASPSPRVPSATPSPAGPALAPGARIGLEPVTHPGYRVRHRDFLGRIDPVGASSPAVDKADATFTVRAGLADRRCVSLEAVNYPGFYLRHQDFAIHLHRRDPSAIFAADATFCPRPGAGGRDISLRSYNYPDRHLYHQRSRLFIATSGDGAAMTFAVRTPW
ncbi:hypothetical protein GCM10023170_061740 [Phytohabitans houttuyneae]|uniref:Alpha-L-arabinofuranosidase B arabinose-binding domain-containing protein n=2 Tax=Phytohabitans houttuyneae TaxID=1076126 RepID=A0A6V8KMT1_9ACTN|nr:hypothetical protein Phou_074460 [Phytohabitans houttuyneae]